MIFEILYLKPFKIDTMKKIALIVLAATLIVGCAEMTQVMDEVNSMANSSSPSLTNDEVIKGLKQALEVGTNNSTAITSKLDGFYKNPEIFIPFPPEAIKVKEKVTALGMRSQVEKFELTMNRAAETAAKEAAPIFINAITSMSIADGFAILRGGENAATQYLIDKTSSQLKVKFNPVVKSAIDQVEVTKYWNPIINTYNKIPLVDKMNPNLEDYISTRAMDGLFLMIEKEEKNIRKNPAARITDLLKKVFA